MNNYRPGLYGRFSAPLRSSLVDLTIDEDETIPEKDNSFSDELYAALLQEEDQMQMYREMKEQNKKQKQGEPIDPESDQLIAKILQEEVMMMPTKNSTMLDDEKLARQLEQEEAMRPTLGFRDSLYHDLPISPFFSRPITRGSMFRAPPLEETDSDDDDDYSDDLIHYAPPPFMNAPNVAVHRNFNHGQIDTDNMSYEELLELEEKMGKVERGVNKTELRQLPIHTFQSSRAKENESSCIICQQDYTDGEKLRTLRCFHAFHQECIDTWLKNKTTCPVCFTNCLE
eukprot:TRINITY_DN8935_c0_g1_i1.p1 TRINITY_DN8935_c0_g1~~TRINITY_DN8935_c0_g1_i1.p1  ORF type:complete len:285 (+),score=62.36 TRINITY_DN8935_c0_g1_i1:58-912(+)